MRSLIVSAVSNGHKCVLKHLLPPRYIRTCFLCCQFHVATFKAQIHHAQDKGPSLRQIQRLQALYRRHTRWDQFQYAMIPSSICYRSWEQTATANLAKLTGKADKNQASCLNIGARRLCYTSQCVADTLSNEGGFGGHHSNGHTSTCLPLFLLVHSNSLCYLTSLKTSP